MCSEIGCKKSKRKEKSETFPAFCLQALSRSKSIKGNPIVLQDCPAANSQMVRQFSLKKPVGHTLALFKIDLLIFVFQMKLKGTQLFRQTWKAMTRNMPWTQLAIEPTGLVWSTTTRHKLLFQNCEMKGQKY